MKDHPPGAGKSSYDLVDSTLLFKTLDLTSGMALADLGCGQGHFALAAAKIVGPEGRILGVDLWPEGLARLGDQATQDHLVQIKTVVADLGARLPIEDQEMDVCLMVTVLHDLVHSGRHEKALAESFRILKPEGVLAVAEFKKIPGPPGPPVEIRMSPEELDLQVIPVGFRKESLTELGPFHYLCLYRRSA